MVLTTEGWVAGISGLVIVALSYFCFAIFLARYTRSRRIETLLQGIVLFAIGSNWLGVVISFLLNVTRDGEVLGQVAMIRTWSWAPAVTATVWMFLVLSLIRPQLKTAVTALYIVLDIVYLYLMYAKTLEYSTYRLVGGLPDSGVQGIAALFLVFYIFSAFLIIGPMYLWIGLKSERPTTQLRGKIIGIGVMLFAFMAIFETVIQRLELLLIARILIAFAILLMYFGFTLPEWLRKKILVEEQSMS